MLVGKGSVRGVQGPLLARRCMAGLGVLEAVTYKVILIVHGWFSRWGTEVADVQPQLQLSHLPA